MADSNIRSNPVNVEQIMEQIRGRIRDQRGVEYTEQQIQDVAAAQLEKFLDPKKVRSGLLEEFTKLRASSYAAEPLSEPADDSGLFSGGGVIRRLLRPLTKLLFNTKAVASVLVLPQAEKERRVRDQVLFELVHNLVIETTRLNIELKNLRMRAESLSGRVEFNERRSRAMEGAVLYQPSKSDVPAPDRSHASTSPPAISATAASESSPDRTRPIGQAPATPGDGSGRRRRRRRRGRRGGGAPQGFANQSPSGVPDNATDAANHASHVPAEPSSSAEMYDDADGPESDEGGSDVDPQ